MATREITLENLQETVSGNGIVREQLAAERAAV